MLSIAPFRLSLALGLMLSPVAARAELGGATATIETDRGRMAARMSRQAEGAFTRHILTRANGGVVHELTNAQGKVFAVTWSGPGKPDLRSVLGPYFAALQPADGIGRAMHGFRRPVQVARADLQIRQEGHMGWFHGAALVPSLAPSGFSAASLAIGE